MRSGGEKLLTSNRHFSIIKLYIVKFKFVKSTNLY